MQTNGSSNERQHNRLTPIGGLSNHEPPIGKGGGSSFFDIPNQIRLERSQRKVNGYWTYTFVPTDPVSHEDYTSIHKVLVICEAKSEDGNVLIEEFLPAPDDRAYLLLWIAHRPIEGDPGEPDFILTGNNGGSILSRCALKWTEFDKLFRSDRFVGSDSDLRVVRWEIKEENSDSKQPGKTIWSREGDDLYYFWITFDHA